MGRFTQNNSFFFLHLTDPTYEMQSFALWRKNIISLSKWMRRNRSGPWLKMQVQTALLNLGMMRENRAGEQTKSRAVSEASSLFRSEAAADRGWCDLISMKSGGSAGRGALRISRLLYCLCPTYLNPQLPAQGPAWTCYI